MKKTNIKCGILIEDKGKFIFESHSGRRISKFNSIQVIENKNPEEIVLLAKVNEKNYALFNEDGKLIHKRPFNNMLTINVKLGNIDTNLFLHEKDNRFKILDTEKTKVSDLIKNESFEYIINENDYLATDIGKIVIGNLNESLYGASVFNGNAYGMKKGNEQFSPFITYELIDYTSAGKMQMKPPKPNNKSYISVGMLVTGYTIGTNTLASGYVKQIKKDSEGWVKEVWVLDSKTRRMLRLKPEEIIIGNRSEIYGY